MRQLRLIGFRLFSAVLFGLIVAGMALMAGWNTIQASGVTYPQLKTIRELREINTFIDAYRQQHHRLPHTLAQLADVKDVENTLYISDGVVYDGWMHPFAYRVQGTHPLVISYGEDGKPGGVGLDTDLTSDNPRMPRPSVTLSQFLGLPSAQDMVPWACISGALAGVLCFITARPALFTRQKAPALILGWLIALAAAVFVGSIITALHVPTGH